MSEIKGQLLGIIMVLIIFGAVSVTVATIFKDSRDKITEKSNDMTSGVETTLRLPTNNNGQLLAYGD